MSTLSLKNPALRLLCAILSLLSFSPLAHAGSTTVVISQTYAAGGNSGATYNADYVELFNLSATTQSLNGFAVQYISSAATSTSVVVIPLPAGVSLAPGQRYLIQATPSTTNGVALPNAADYTASGLAAGASAGRLYLTSNITPLAGGSCAITSAVVDYVGYGSGSGCFEGTKYAPTPSTTLADIRTNPCVDTDDNGADFTTTTNAPQNSSAARTPCGTGTSTGISITGTATPTSVYKGSSTLLAVTLTPGTNPASTGIAVKADLSAFGGSSTQPLYDDGTHGDATANDNIYSYSLIVPTTATLGSNTINLSASDAQAHSATGTIAVTVLAPVTLIPIHTVQGNVAGTAAYNGQTVMVSGIVTGIRANGYFLQAKDSDADADPATPEGIFVHTGTGAVPTAAILGSNLQVTGTVALYPTSSVIPGTELDTPTAPTVLSTGNPLPTAVTLTTTNPSTTGGFAQLQRLQSMRVAVPSFTVTGPTEGILLETAETYSSDGIFWGTVTGVPRPVREPGLEILDPLTAGQAATIPRFDDNPELLRVDSLSMVPTPGPLDLSTSTVLTNLSGILDFSNPPADLSTYVPSIVIDAATRPGVSGGLTVTPVAVANTNEITIGDQNVERFYNTVKDTTGATVITAAAYALRLSKASLAIRNVLRSPDILCIEEMENIDALNDLIAKISSDATAAGQTDPAYTGYLVQGNDTSGINVAFLVKLSKITVVDVSQFGKATTFVQPSTGASALLNDRPPLVLHAGIKRTGLADYPLTITVNHLRSLNNVTDNTGTGMNARAKREQQAEFLAKLVQGYQANGEHVIVVGDLNAFEFNDGIVDSIGILRGSAAPANQDILAGTTGLVTPNLVDLAPTNLATNTYSYSYVGNAQSIDHFLVTQDIAPIMRTSAAHYNADFPAIYRNDMNRPEVGSDHDGIVGYITVPGTTVLTFTPASLLFGTQTLKTTSTLPVVVKNTGTTAITITSIVASASFAQTNTCGASLAGGASCTINVSFTPTATGPITGTITLTDSDVTGTQTIAVSGTGAGVFSATALSASTTNAIVGSSITLNATVTGNAAGTPTGTVKFLDGATQIGTTQTLSATGTASVATTTLAVGVHSLTAVYSGDTTYPASTSPVTTVTIVAAPVPDFTLSVANANLQANGQNPSSSTTVNVTFVNGFAQTVSFSCSGLPTNSRCSFSPASLTATGSSKLTVTVNSASGALRSPFGNGTTEGVLACGLLALPLLLRRRGRSALRNALRGVALLLLLGGGLAATSGCGGNAVTSGGTSTVTVTGTGGSTTHTATFTLTVQ